MPTYAERLEQRVRADVLRRLAKHEIVRRHENGLYSHWRCGDPTGGVDWFHIVTWPGSLCYTGDMGEYLFQGTDDMIAFMRRSALSYSYAAEKCVAASTRNSGIDEFRFECIREAIQQRIDDDPDRAKDYKALLKRVERCAETDEHQVRNVLYTSGLFDEVPDGRAYTYRFLFALHAIKWFCDRVCTMNAAVTG